MTTKALAPVTITDDQIDLIKKTIAVGATPDELKMFFYDCERRGVHPMDKTIHFTKRNAKDERGNYYQKYVPIVGIDFLRAKAASTGQCAGISDPLFTGKPKATGFAATVTVKRVVGGVICEFTATARWEEYCPKSGQDIMWQKMPHTMLGKCAEALALRKGFPGDETGNLMIAEEVDMDRMPEMDLGKALTQDFPMDTWLPGVLERHLPAEKTDPARVFIQTDNGTMQFSTFLAPTVLDGHMGQDVEFQYGKQGRLRVVTDLRLKGHDDPQATFTPQIGQEIPDAIAPGPMVIEHTETLIEETTDTDDDASDAFGLGVSVRGFVLRVSERTGVSKKGPWEKTTLQLEPRQGEPITCSTFAKAGHFDQSLTSFHELDKRGVLFQCVEGQEYPKGSGKFPLELSEICLDPLWSTPEPEEEEEGMSLMGGE